jgi:hypothetical protein
MNSLSVCPADVIKAPIDVVWRLLTTPARWGDFFDATILSVDPPGTATAGQRITLLSGRWPLRFRLAFKFIEVSATEHSLRLEIRLPFGIINNEHLTCTEVGAAECRVAYHCNFDFPAGVRGALLAESLRGAFQRGPADSLARLKRAAEQKFGSMSDRDSPDRMNTRTRIW